MNIENINITYISEIKSLGVILDSTMSMEKQVNSVTRSAYRVSTYNHCSFFMTFSCKTENFP